jgi:predicted esterase
MTREDREAEMRDYVGYLDALLDALVARVPRKAVKLVLLGFSQGTATAARWAARGAARLDRLVLWAGLLPPDVEPAQEREKLNALDLVLVAGERDDYVTAARLAEQRSALDAAGVRHRVLAFDGGHAISPDALRRLAQLR